MLHTDYNRENKNQDIMVIVLLNHLHTHQKNPPKLKARMSFHLF